MSSFLVFFLSNDYGVLLFSWFGVLKYFFRYFWYQNFAHKTNPFGRCRTIKTLFFSTFDKMIQNFHQFFSIQLQIFLLRCILQLNDNKISLYLFCQKHYENQKKQEIYEKNFKFQKLKFLESKIFIVSLSTYTPSTLGIFLIFIVSKFFSIGNFIVHNSCCRLSFKWLMNAILLEQKDEEFLETCCII